MVKKKISKEQDFCFKDMPIIKLKKGVKLYDHDPTINLKDRKFISKALWGAIRANDIEAFKDILSTHLELVNKEDLSRKTGISKRTIFRMLSPEGNPTLENVCKIIHWICEEQADQFTNKA